MKMLSHRNTVCMPIKYIFFIHLVLAFWVLEIPYVPRFALVYNLLFLVSLFWATENTESNEPLQFALWINLLSVLFDGSVIVREFDTVFRSYQYYYGLTLSVSLFVRIVTSVSLYMTGRARNEAKSTMVSSNSTKDVPETDCKNLQP